MYITHLLADAFVTLLIGVATAFSAISLGCDPKMSWFVGLSIGMSSYACRISTESRMMAEDLMIAIEEGIRVYTQKEKADDIDE